MRIVGSLTSSAQPLLLALALAGVSVGCTPHTIVNAPSANAPTRGISVNGIGKANGKPKTPGELMEHECLMQGVEAWPFVVAGKTVTIRPQGRFKADNGEALAAAAVAGLGIAALPDFVIEPYIASGALVALLANYPSPEAGLYVVRPPGAFAPRKVRALIDILIERFGRGS